MEERSCGGGKKEIFPLWSNLPDGPLESIADKLITLSDYIRFRSVCRSWRSAAPPSNLRFQQPPLLLVGHDYEQDNGASFFSPSTGRLLHPYLPELRGKAVLASGHGWLVVLDVDSKALSLLNPFTRSQIVLPPTSSFREWSGTGLNWVPFISSSPLAAGDCVVMVLKCYDAENLAAFCKVGDTSWTTLHTGSRTIPVSIAYHDEKFYVLDLVGNVSFCRAATPDLPEHINSLRISRQHEQHFFGVMDGKLYYLGIEYDYLTRDCFMAYVRVCSVDPTGSLEWTDIQSFGDKALFLSAYQLFMVSVKGYTGWRADCVYSTFSLGRDFPDEEDAIYVVNLKNDLCDLITWEESEMPIDLKWLTPSFC